jgi:hypothetical protein
MLRIARLAALSSVLLAPGAEAQKESTKVSADVAPVAARVAAKPVTRKPLKVALRRDKETRKRVLRDVTGGLQFDVSGGRLVKLKATASDREPAWQVQLKTRNGIVVRILREDHPQGAPRDKDSVIDTLVGQRDLRQDPELEAREVEVFESDLLDSMGIAQAGGRVGIVLPGKRFTYEELIVFAGADVRYLIQIRYRNSHLLRGARAKFETSLFNGLKISDPTGWK